MRNAFLRELIYRVFVEIILFVPVMRKKLVKMARGGCLEPKLAAVCRSTAGPTRPRVRSLLCNNIAAVTMMSVCKKPAQKSTTGLNQARG